MRTAEVAAICTVTALAAAASVFAVLDHHRPLSTGAGNRSPDPGCMAVLPDAHAPIIKPPPPQAPPSYSRPVGDQFLGESSDLLIDKGDGPPMLFVLGASDLDGRYGWRMPRVAKLMTAELASVLDDACTPTCPPAAEAARTAAHTFDDDPSIDEGAARTRAWVKDDAGMNEYMHELRERSRSGAITVDVTCTCASETVGMRMWNDITWCDAVLREKGHVLATYRPRQLTMSGKESIEEPIDAWDQTVELPGGATLVTETGWEYTGDNVERRATKTTVRTGPHWR